MVKHLLASPAALALQIEVVGSDLGGQQFIERAQTLTVTRDGATILLANKLAPESELIVRNLLTKEEALARVVGHIREDASGHVYGIALVDPTFDLWRAQFSPTETDSHQYTVLECSHCHLVRAFTLTEIEMEIFESKGALTRRCECSNSSTIWKRTERRVSSERRQSSPGKSRKAETVPAPRGERRGNKRSALKPAACIRHSGQEEIVVCDDMSRGGFRFRSRKRYSEGIRIEVAVPFTRSSVNIFVPARIVYSQELSGESHRHGVAYLKTTRKFNQDI
jgi:hypothetical protein